MPTKVYSLRLREEDEPQAVQYLEYYLAQGYSVRDIVTHALNTALGTTPEMYRSAQAPLTLGTLQATLDERLDSLIDKLVPMIVSQMAQDVRSGTVDFSETSDDAEMRYAKSLGNLFKGGWG